MQNYTVEPLYVKSGQDVIAADFYHPEHIAKPAVIVMAHGFACLRQFKLVQYAQQFAQAGYAVVLFDYRYWGGSTGRPRELVSISQQLADWQTMISHLTERKSIDPQRIVLWGTGLSGAYVLHLAAMLTQIQAVMAQVPFLDGAEYAKLYPLQQLTKALKLSSQDYMGAKVGLAPTRLALQKSYGLSFFPQEDLKQGLASIVHPDFYWSGAVPARVFFKLVRYRPILEFRKINIPVLFIAAKQDSLIPIELSREAATNIAPFVQYHEWDMQHFDIFHPPYIDDAIQMQLAFLHQHLGVH